jgi:tyrosine-protein phosphatase SIW14
MKYGGFMYKFFLFSIMALSSPATLFAESVQQIPNLVRVNENIERGGRPSASDVDALARQNIRTIINLENNSNAIAREKRQAAALGINYIESPMSWKTRPSDAQVDALMRALQDQNNFPIFIHCMHGEDRTGLIVGLYRVLVEKMAPKEAYAEMIRLGFHTEFRALDQYFRDRTGYNP